MKTVEGDLIEMGRRGDVDLIVHGCNCLHEMSKGIAAAISKTFPEALEADRETAHGDREKLGTISVAQVRSLHVVNAYTQFHWKGREGKADYAAIDGAFQEIARRFDGYRIAYPKIGAGLAGGDWSEIATLIERALEGQDHRLVVLPER